MEQYLIHAPNTWRVYSTTESIVSLFICGYICPSFIMHFIAQSVTVVDLLYNPLQYILGFHINSLLSAANFPTPSNHFWAYSTTWIWGYFFSYFFSYSFFLLSWLGLVFFRSFWGIVLEVSGKANITMPRLFCNHQIRLLAIFCRFLKHSFSLWKTC